MIRAQLSQWQRTAYKQPVFPSASNWQPAQVTPSSRQLKLVLNASDDITARQNAPNVIQLTREKPVSEGGSITEVAYEIGATVIHASGPDAASIAAAGVVRMAVTGSAHQFLVTLSPDVAWERAAKRTLPFIVDVPITPLESLVDSMPFNTVSSCAPSVASAVGTFVVGVKAGCRYWGETAFEVALPAGIVSATLHLFCPGRTGQTGVRVFANTGGATYYVLPRTPTWNDVVQVVTKTNGIAQSGGNGSWQTWDITPILKQWATGGLHADSGITLEGNGSPIRFASPASAEGDSVATAPYVDVLFGAPSTATSPH